MNYKQFFLRRLYLHSPAAFSLACLFIILYGIFFFKKMDMTVFAYNSMFVSKLPGKKTSAYAVKINDQPIGISSRLWWKKDFLESSLIGYADYLNNEQTTYLHDFLSQRIKNPITKQFLISLVVVQNADPMDFVQHYLATAGHQLKPEDKVEIIKYGLEFSNTTVKKTDSTIIFIKRRVGK